MPQNLLKTNDSLKVFAYKAIQFPQKNKESIISDTDNNTTVESATRIYNRSA